MVRDTSPTAEAYTQLTQAYDHFNDELFAGDLPPVMFIFNVHPKRAGHFAPDRWKRGSEQAAHEIAMNPALFETMGFLEAMQTLVHEMVHLWQQEHGEPSRTGYHNREWADKMEALGLMPSTTGKPGGKRTGQKMADYPIEEGRFLASVESLKETGFDLTWATIIIPKESKPTKKKDRVKFTCEGCGLNAWAKPSAVIGCWECQQPLQCEPIENE